MTENKRFTMDTEIDYSILYFDNNLILTDEEVLNLLNELHEENSKLHIENDFLQNEHQHFKEILQENNKLKQFIRKISKASHNSDEIILLNGYGYKIPKEAKE